jgi:subtilisin family serine protease
MRCEGLGLRRLFLAVLLISGVLFAAVTPLNTVFSGSSVDVASPREYVPIMRVAADADKNHNGIEDGLDQEIAGKSSVGISQEFVNVTVMMKSKPTVHDADLFVSAGGFLTTSPWTQAVYGFGGRIPYGGIGVFVRQCPDVLLVEKEAVCNSSLAYAAEQVGARTYVWNTLGLQGDPNSSIAVLDTGIDASHLDFSPGFGDKNFSRKVVGWNNQINAVATPFDDNGHGSHVSGLAAGDGFFSVDASGYATATWGANLGSVSSTGTYLVSGMMVNKTGTITLKVKWASTGSAKLSAVPLYYGGKSLSTGSWSQKASVSTPSQNTWYTLTYNVASTPSGGYDMYHVLMTLRAGTGNLYVVFTVSWPYTPPADGFSAWTGIAPQAKLVGVKVLDSSGSGTSTGLINGIDWIIANRMTYHITVASMSLGFSSQVNAVDSAVVNLVNSGVCTVVAAGNSGSGANYIYTPGSVDEVITAAAMNQFDDVASYSSQGGTSRYTGNTVKPDVTAPGGSFFGVPLFSADSNYNDAEGEWSDVQANDSAPMQGTSMATPVVTGAVDVVEQAMGGYGAWKWTRSQALLPKMILLMTATETYPNLREGGTSSTSPTLERGGKDAQEGYGRLNLDAATDAVLKTYQVGTTASGSLGVPPTPTNISVLGERLEWARNVQLVSGFEYNFTLSVPTGADYDLYLYNSTGTAYGEPAIVAKSTTSATGGTETFKVTAPYTGTYYIVVKRATETTGSGNFTLTAVFTGATVPLSGWQEDPFYTNASYVLNSKPSSLYLELDATGTSSKVAIFNLNVPKLSLTSYAYVDATVTGTTNAKILLRFFMDNGNSFDVVYWGSPATLNRTIFDLSPYAGRTLTGLVYIGLMSSDGNTANINITQIAFETQALPPLVPLSGWQEDPQYTNAPYVLIINPSSVHLELDATNADSKVAIFNANTPKLKLSDYTYVNASVTGTQNARILLRFFLDDGSSFDVVYWTDPATLNAVKFDLSPYAGRKLTGLVYIGLMSSDGATADITMAQIAFGTQTLLPLVPLSGWLEDPQYSNSPYVLTSSAFSLFLQVNATDTSSKVAIFNLNVPKLSLSSYAYVNATVTGTSNAKILLRFFMDNGNSFDVVYWGSCATLNAIRFDLSPDAGRTLTGLVYVALMSSDGSTANINITQVAFNHV